MATARELNIQKAKSLPYELLRFFHRYGNVPTSQRLMQSMSQPPPSIISTAATTSPSDPNTSTTESHLLYAQADQWTERNPFRLWKNPKTGRWHEPPYSLRQQGDLVKMAQAHGIEHLLPPGPKSSYEKERKRTELGLRVKGTGEGQRVKGKVWERTMKTRLETRRQAMIAMPRMIEQWKRLGHGKGWRQWPK